MFNFFSRQPKITVAIKAPAKPQAPSTVDPLTGPTLDRRLDSIVRAECRLLERVSALEKLSYEKSPSVIRAENAHILTQAALQAKLKKHEDWITAQADCIAKLENIAGQAAQLSNHVHELAKQISHPALDALVTRWDLENTLRGNKEYLDALDKAELDRAIKVAEARGQVRTQTISPKGTK